MSPLQVRKSLRLKSPLSAASGSKSGEDKKAKSAEKRRRKVLTLPPPPSRLSRALRLRRQQRTDSRASSLPDESLPSGSGSPSLGTSDPATSTISGSMGQTSATDTTLITGGTTIWSCSSVIVNMNGANGESESPVPGSSSLVSPQMKSQASSLDTYETSCEVYRRHMSLMKKGRHPLWIPQPNLQLPLDYRRRGTQVGDVGIITEDGAFDFMFSICHTAADLVDLSSFPAGFQPINPPILPAKEVVVSLANAARDTLTSRGISKQILISEEFLFTCARPDGAILVLPDGAVTERLSNFARFQQYYAQNAESWYTFARETKGLDVRNGDLHLVYGCDKATEWGMIAFDNPHRGTQLAELRFRNLGENWRFLVGTPYAWEHTDDAEGRVGPRDREMQELGGSRDQMLLNQTLFIQTINTTLREEDWQRIASSAILVDCKDCGSSGLCTAAACQGSISGGSSLDASHSAQNQYQTTPYARKIPGARFYPTSDPRKQPSQVLNDYLLSKYPEAKVAATASEVWSHVEDDCVDNPEGLVVAVLGKYSPMVDADGVVSFVVDCHLEEALAPLIADGETVSLPQSFERLSLVSLSPSGTLQEGISELYSSQLYVKLGHEETYLQGGQPNLRPRPSPRPIDEVSPRPVEAPRSNEKGKERDTMSKQNGEMEDIKATSIGDLRSEPTALEVGSSDDGTHRVEPLLSESGEVSFDPDSYHPSSALKTNLNTRTGQKSLTKVAQAQGNYSDFSPAILDAFIELSDSDVVPAKSSGGFTGVDDLALSPISQHETASRYDNELNWGLQGPPTTARTLSDVNKPLTLNQLSQPATAHAKRAFTTSTNAGIYTGNPYAQAGWSDFQNSMAGSNWQRSVHIPPTFGTLPLSTSGDGVVLLKFVLNPDIRNCNIYGPANQEGFQVHTIIGRSTVVNRTNGGVLGEIAWRQHPQIEVPGVIPRQLTGQFLQLSPDRQFRTLTYKSRNFIWAPNPDLGIYLYEILNRPRVQHARIRSSKQAENVIYLEVASESAREPGLLLACIFSTILLRCNGNID